MGFSAASAQNTYIANFEASGKLQVAYARNKDKFQLPQYVTYTKAKQMTGFYREIDPDTAVRIVTQNDYTWADGAPAPGQQTENQPEFQNQPFACTRYYQQQVIGDLALDQADEPFAPIYTGQLGTWAMTNREVGAAAALANQANYARYGNTSTAANLSGSNWYTSSLDNAYIQKGLQAAGRSILLQTAGSVEYKDLYILMNPVTAGKLGTAPEVKQVNIQASYSLEYQKGKTLNKMFGLPNELFGFNVIVNSAMQVTTRKNFNGTATRGFIIPDDTIYVGARPGDLDAMEGATSFSTLHFFVYQDMQVETHNDPFNKRTVFRVIDNWDVRMVAPATAYQITAVGT